MPRTLTFPFVTRDSLEVLVDVWVPTTPKQSPAPLLIWYHGGGLVQGNRKTVAAHHQRAVDDLGVVLVSPDYRLAPQVRVPELQEDLVALTRYVEERLQQDLRGAGEDVSLDLQRIAVSGSSAGGWIAFWIGFGMLDGLSPSFLSGIRAIAPIYPITTMDHPFFLEKQTPFMGKLENPASDFAEFTDPATRVTANTADTPMRGKLYMHAQQEALFPSLLFSDQQRNEGWLHKTDVTKYVQQHASDKGSQWAPVYMIHGVRDSAVAIDQARLVDKALRAAKHDVTLDERADRDHLWDILEPTERFEPYWAFLTKHLGL